MYHVMYQRGAVTMTSTTRVFRNGRSLAVRIPKEYGLDCGEVYINKIDGMIIITPVEELAEQFNKGISMFTGDFLAERMPADSEPPKVEL